MMMKYRILILIVAMALNVVLSPGLYSQRKPRFLEKIIEQTDVVCLFMFVSELSKESQEKVIKDLENLQKTNRKFPHRYKAHTLMALLYFKNHEYEKCAKTIDLIIKDDGREDVQVLKLKAVCLGKLKKYAEANGVLEHVLKDYKAKLPQEEQVKLGNVMENNKLLSKQEEEKAKKQEAPIKMK